MACRLFDKYVVEENGDITNGLTGHKLKRTVKGYTIGYYINGKFCSIQYLQKHLTLIETTCPF